MKPLKSSLLRVLTSLALTAPALATPKTPLKSKVCVRESSGNGECKAYDFTWHVQGVSCLENCIAFDAFDGCKLRNRCEYDDGSGCFKRHTCVELGTLSNCKKWEESVACD